MGFGVARNMEGMGKRIEDSCLRWFGNGDFESEKWKN